MHHIIDGCSENLITTVDIHAFQKKIVPTIPTPTKGWVIYTNLLFQISGTSVSYLPTLPVMLTNHVPLHWIGGGRLLSNIHDVAR